MYRLEPFVTGHTYHIFNRTIEKKRIFEQSQYCQFFIEIAQYYRSGKATVSHSAIRLLDPMEKSLLIQKVQIKRYFRVEILSYCLMPTHFHFLVRQKQEDGVTRFASNITNSFTHYYNSCNERKGPLFLPTFKAVRIQGADQLIHTSRYIHLNPCTSELLPLSQLPFYQWSSYKAFITGQKDLLVDTPITLKIFGSNNYTYKEFVEANADYQKVLDRNRYEKNELAF